jgi:hypothetical protein
MQKVDPQKLTQGKRYYLEYRGNTWYKKDNDNSYRAKGKFIDYVHNPTGISAIFENVEAVNNKPLYYIFLPNKIGQFSFHVGPNGCAMDIYEPINGLRQEASRRMINSQYPLPEDVISTSNMFSEEPYVPPPTYEETSPKTSVGNDLAKKIGQYFGGRRRRKTLNSKKSRKSRKSRKTKSRRRR